MSSYINSDSGANRVNVCESDNKTLNVSCGLLCINPRQSSKAGRRNVLTA